MMEFLSLWIGTIIASFGLEIANELRIRKDIADVEYKIDVKRLSELGEQLNPNVKRITRMSMLVPIFNVLREFQKSVQYNRSMVVDQLSVMGVLEEMSEIEKTEYEKNPTGLNAVIVPIKFKIRLLKAIRIKIDGYDIYYEMNKSFDDFTVIKANGPLSRLTPEEQKEKILKTWQTFTEKVMQNYGDKEELIKSAINKEENYIDLTVNEDIVEKDNEIPTPYELKMAEVRQDLINLRVKLAKEKEKNQIMQIGVNDRYTVESRRCRGK